MAERQKPVPAPETPPDIEIFLDATLKAGPPCSIRVLPLTDEQRAQLNRAMKDERVTVSAIHRILTTPPPKGWGMHIAIETVRRHQRGRCNCQYV
jgi:hypothetical protein